MKKTFSFNSSSTADSSPEPERRLEQRQLNRILKEFNRFELVSKHKSRLGTTLNKKKHSQTTGNLRLNMNFNLSMQNPSSHELNTNSIQPLSVPEEEEEQCDQDTDSDSQSEQILKLNNNTLQLQMDNPSRNFTSSRNVIKQCAPQKLAAKLACAKPKTQFRMVTSDQEVFFSIFLMRSGLF
jgi:hypothetical protein